MLAECQEEHLASLLGDSIISCFIKIQIGLAFLVPDYPGWPEKEAVKWVSYLVCFF